MPAADASPCPHTTFASRVAVRQAETLADGRIRCEVALRVRCAACQAPLTYEFAPVAWPGTYVPTARQSVDGTEARLGAWLRVAPVEEDTEAWPVAQPLPGESV